MTRRASRDVVFGATISTALNRFSYHTTEVSMLRFILTLAAAQAATLNGWVFTPQGLVGGGSATCGQNFSIVYSVTNATGNLSAVSVQSTGGGGGGGGTTTVGTALTGIPFVQGVNNSVNYTCPATFVPGFGGTR